MYETKVNFNVLEQSVTTTCTRKSRYNVDKLHQGSYKPLEPLLGYMKITLLLSHEMLQIILST